MKSQRLGTKRALELFHPTARSRREVARPLPFMERAIKRDRIFKRIITIATFTAVVATVAAVPAGRRSVLRSASWVRTEFPRVLGVEPSRSRIEADLALKREQSMERTRFSLEKFYHGAPPAIRELFDRSGMSPRNGLIRWGFGDQSFLISSRVFDPDDAGRSYRLKPRVRSVWLRNITIIDGPFGMFLVPDEPETREAAVAAGAIVDLRSIQTTNSWGFRGGEPETHAELRGIVLGDSFMLGMFVGDSDTPSVRLERYLAQETGKSTSILNTGSIGYGPEQYFYTLKSVGDRFRPSFVVVSVCPNDFGEGFEVLSKGKGDWEGAKYWLDAIGQWCRSRRILCVLAVVPCDVQFLSTRKDAFYPGLISNHFSGSPLHYCDPLNEFIDENIKLVQQAIDRDGRRPRSSPLYNMEIADNHFSPLGCDLWARTVGRRVARLLAYNGIVSTRDRSTNHEQIGAD